jgi:ribonuclease P protein component
VTGDFRPFSIFSRCYPMLPRENRLTSDYYFRRVRNKGTRVNTPLFGLSYLRKRTPSASRFGFVVSTKIDKRAVKRNRVKRLFREGVRSVMDEVKDGYDVVFWVRRTALEADTKELWSTIRDALKRGGMIA